MNFISLPCLFFSDKAFAACNSDYTSVRFPIQLPSHLVFTLPLHHDENRIRLPWRVTVTPAVSVKPDNPLLGKTVCRSNLKSLRFFSFVLSIEVAKGVRGFARRGARFRTKYTRLLNMIQVNLTQKTVMSRSLTVENPSNSMGTRFHTKRCAVSHEVNTLNLLYISRLKK